MRPNVLVLGPSYTKYISASYQNDFLYFLKKISSNYYHYSDKTPINVEQLISIAGFEPDMVIYNHGWLLDDPSIEDIVYTQVNGRWDKRIKQILILNKEYSRLEEKVKEIRNSKFDFIFTHLHNIECHNSNLKTSIFMPLAYNPTYISSENIKLNKERRYDLFFSGILQNWNFKNLQGDLRIRIQKEIFYCINDFPLIKKLKYNNLNIYWKPFYRNRFKRKLSEWIHGKRLSHSEYYKVLNNSKTVLHTSSPMGIISTRVFETMASGAIGLFSDESNANYLFKSGHNYIGFNDVSDFISSLISISIGSNETYIQRIADFGRLEVEEKHSWKVRVDEMISKVYESS